MDAKQIASLEGRAMASSIASGPTENELMGRCGESDERRLTERNAARLIQSAPRFGFSFPAESLAAKDCSWDRFAGCGVGTGHARAVHPDGCSAR